MSAEQHLAQALALRGDDLPEDALHHPARGRLVRGRQRRPPAQHDTHTLMHTPALPLTPPSLLAMPVSGSSAFLHGLSMDRCQVSLVRVVEAEKGAA